MKNRENNLYVKDKAGHDYWVFDLNAPNNIHHGVRTEPRGRRVLFLELETSKGSYHFDYDDYVFACYRRHTKEYYILSYTQLLAVLVSPDEVQNELHGYTDRCSACDWYTADEGL